MQDRDTIKNFLIAGSVFLLIMILAPRLIGPLIPSQTPRKLNPTVTPVPQNESPTTRPTQGDLPMPASVQDAQSTSGYSIVEADTTETIIMGSANANGSDDINASDPYRMRLTLSNVGASIGSATMTDHAEELGSDERYRLLSPLDRDDGTTLRSFVIESITMDGIELSLANRKWNTKPLQTSEYGQSTTFWIAIENAGQPAIKLTQHFFLPKQARDEGRHDVEWRITVENTSANPHKVILTYRGGVGVRGIPGARMAGPFFDWGVSDGTRVVGKRTQHSDLARSPDHSVNLFTPSPTDPTTRFTWAATGNTYFTCTIAPRSANGKDSPNYLSDISAVDLDGDPFTTDDLANRFVTSVRTLAARQQIVYAADVYLGEKDGDAFRTVEDYNNRNYYYQISQSFGICTFSWLVELMIWLLNTLVIVTFDYGIAILILVLVVRALLHPITKRGQINMVRMQKTMGEFSPKFEELKKKYGNDKARMQQEQMKLYREQGVNPAANMMSSCLPMFIQMPIWVALFLSLSNNILLRHQPLHFTWIHDLSAQDALYTFASPLVVPLLGWTIPSFNLLPLLVAVFMYTQQKMQPKPAPNPNASDQQRQQQEMMQKMGPMMSVMMLVIFYKMPSGLNLYIMCSSMFGTLEQHYIRKHIKEREAAGTLLKPARNKALADKNKPAKLSFLAKLQQMADQAQKQQAKKAGKIKRNQ